MTITTQKPSFQPVTLHFEDASEFADFFAALAAYSRKEKGASTAAVAYDLGAYSGNARKTVKGLVAEIAEATGHVSDVLPDFDSDNNTGSSRY